MMWSRADNQLELLRYCQSYYDRIAIMISTDQSDTIASCVADMEEIKPIPLATNGSHEFLPPEPPGAIRPFKA